MGTEQAEQQASLISYLRTNFDCCPGAISVMFSSHMNWQYHVGGKDCMTIGTLLLCRITLMSPFPYKCEHMRTRTHTNKILAVHIANQECTQRDDPHCLHCQTATCPYFFSSYWLFFLILFIPIGTSPFLLLFIHYYCITRLVCLDTTASAGKEAKSNLKTSMRSLPWIFALNVFSTSIWYQTLIWVPLMQFSDCELFLPECLSLV